MIDASYDCVMKTWELPMSNSENSPSAGATDRSIYPEFQPHTLQRYLQLWSKRTIHSTFYRSRNAVGFIIKAAAQPAESNCWLVQPDKNDYLFAWQQCTVTNTPSEELSSVDVHWDCVLVCATVVVPPEGQMDKQKRLKGIAALQVPQKYMERSKKL